MLPSECELILQPVETDNYRIRCNHIEGVLTSIYSIPYTSWPYHNTRRHYKIDTKTLTEKLNSGWGEALIPNVDVRSLAVPLVLSITSNLASKKLDFLGQLTYCF